MSVVKILNSRWLSKIVCEKRLKVCYVLTGNISSTLKIPVNSLSTNRGNFSQDSPKVDNIENKSNNEKSQNDSEKSNESKYLVLKRMLSQYGAFGMGVHITLSLFSLGLVYQLILWGVDVQGFMEQIFNFNLADYTPLNTQQAGYSAAFIAAYTIHKLILPVRATASIVTIRYLVKYLRKIGYFK